MSFNEEYAQVEQLYKDQIEFDEKEFQYDLENLYAKYPEEHPDYTPDEYLQVIDNESFVFGCRFYLTSSLVRAIYAKNNALIKLYLKLLIETNRIPEPLYHISTQNFYGSMLDMEIGELHSHFFSDYSLKNKVFNSLLCISDEAINALLPYQPGTHLSYFVLMNIGLCLYL